VVTGTVVVVVVTGTVVVVVVTGTVVVVVVVATVVVVFGLVVVVVAPRVVVVVGFLVGGSVVVFTAVRGGAGAVVSVVPLTSVLRNAVKRPESGAANVVVVVDLGEVVADAPGDAGPGAAATTDVGTGTNGTPVAPSARTGASVGACE
jgi:hypothetical protein